MEGSEFRELLAADAALMLGLADAPDVAAALQRYWARRHQPGATFESELAHIARLAPEALNLIRTEVERLLSSTGGDAKAALTQHGGLDRSIHLALQKRGGDLTRALSVMGVPLRTPLRTLPEDRYVGFEAAGIGGMGVVYAALDTEMNRRVAFKMVRPHAEPGTESQTPSHPLEATRPPKDTPESEVFEQLKARLVQEAWVTGGLEHPGIVPVYEIGLTPTGIPYYTMRYIRGERTLADAIAEKQGAPLEERLALLEPFLKVCDTLRYAHDKGVVHRDLKPANVALGQYGEVVLLDWGLARLEGREDVASSEWRRRVAEMREDASFQTMDGGALGTAGYMAPEAALGRLDEVDQRSDVYSLGTILFEILTGRLPFQFRSFPEYASLIVHEDPPEAHGLDSLIPRPLSVLCARLLARDRDARPSSSEEVARSVREWQVSDAATREVEVLLRDASAFLSVASTLSGVDRLTQVDRAAAALAQVRTRRPQSSRASELEAALAELRNLGIAEQERAAGLRTLRRASLVAGAVIAVSGFVVAGVVDRARQRTQEALTENRELTTRLGATLDERNVALASLTSSERTVRSRALLLASQQESLRDPIAGLILARGAAKLSPSPQTVQGVLSALKSCHELAVIRSFDGPAHIAFPRETDWGVVWSGASATAYIYGVGGDLRASLPDHEGGVAAALATPDRILTVSKSRVVRIWHSHGERIAQLPRPVHSNFSHPSSVALLPGGGVFALTGPGGAPQLYDVEGQLSASIGPEGLAIDRAYISPDGTRIVTVDEYLVPNERAGEPAIRLWSDSGAALGVLFAAKHDAQVAAPGLVTNWAQAVRVTFSDDSQHLALADGRSVIVFDRDGRRTSTIRDEEPIGYVARFGQDSAHLYTTSNWETVRTACKWTLAGDLVSKLVANGNHEILPRDAGALAESATGTLVWRSWDGAVNGTLVHGIYHALIQISPSGETLFLLERSGGSGVRLMRMDGSLDVKLDGHSGPVTSVALSEKDQVVWTASEDGTVRRWTLNDPRALQSWPSSDYSSLRFAPGSATPLLTGWEKPPRLWLDGEVHGELVGHSGPVHSIAFAPDGSAIATAGEDGTARVWRGDRAIASMQHQGPVYAVEFDESGQHVVTASEDGFARVWDLQGHAVAKLGPHDGPTWLAKMDRAKKRVVTVATQRFRGDVYGAPVVSIWNLSGSKLNERRLGIGPSIDGPDVELIYHGDDLWCRWGANLYEVDGDAVVVPTASGDAGAPPAPDGSASVSPLGGQLAVPFSDHTVRIFDMKGRQRASVPGGSIALFSPTGDRFIVRDGSALRVCKTSGQELLTIGYEGGPWLLDVTWHPSGRRVYTVGPEGIQVWPVDWDEIDACAERRVTRPLNSHLSGTYDELLGTPR